MGTEAAIAIVLALINNAGQISALIQQAKAENRDISPEEWKTVLAADDAARTSLADAIKAAG